MCIGIPMQVVAGDAHEALCVRAGSVTRVSMMLVGEVPPGTYVLTHLGSAVRVLDDAEARLIDDALEGLAAATNGGDFERLFGDLIDREPQLPEHLLPALKK